MFSFLKWKLLPQVKEQPSNLYLYFYLLELQLRTEFTLVLFDKNDFVLHWI